MRPRDIYTIRAHPAGLSPTIRTYLKQNEVNVQPDPSCDPHMITVPPHGSVFLLQEQDFVPAVFLPLIAQIQEFATETAQLLVLAQGYPACLARLPTIKDQRLIQGCLAVLAALKNVVFLPTLSAEGVALCLRSVGKREQGFETSPLRTRQKPRAKTLGHAQDMLMEGLGNCGETKAATLFDHHGTPAAIFHVLTTESAEGDKIGPKFNTWNRALLMKKFN